MDSLKNTVIAVVLLGVTYGVYQVITTPDPTFSENEFLETVIEEPQGDSEMALASNASTERREIPKSLLEMESNSDALAPPKLLEDNAPPSDVKRNVPRTQIPHASNNNRLPSAPNDSDRIADLREELKKGSSPPLREEQASPSNSFDPNVRQASGEVSTNVPRPGLPPSQLWQVVDAEVQRGEFKQALSRLSRYYGDPSLNGADREKLLNWLDALAGKVIYSTEHYLKRTPYIIQPGDTLADLSRRWRVPQQLIYYVNRAKISDPKDLQAGVELKMIVGPFDAEIDTQSGTLTVFLNNDYAGRFDIQLAPQVQPTRGEYSVVQKLAQDKSGTPFKIVLNDQLYLHAMDQSNKASSIGLNRSQASELFAILSSSSTVRVIR